MALDMNKQQALAKEIKPIIDKYKEIEQELITGLDHKLFTTRLVSLANNLIKLLRICNRYGFPDETVNNFTTAVRDVITKIRSEQDEKKVNDYADWVIRQYECIVQVAGIPV